MERKQVLNLLKEIAAVCNRLDGTVISLIAPEVQGSISTGYMVHIKSTLTSQELDCLRNIIKKHHLTMKTEMNTILIYKSTI